MKRSDHLRPLSLDHYQGLQVCRRLQKGLHLDAPVEELRSFLFYFWDVYLVNHFRQEENVLLPALESAGGSALGIRMVAEHWELKGYIDSFRNGASKKEAFTEFAERLLAHIRFEERELFPFLQTRTDESRMETIGNQLHDGHQDIDPAWPVSFWEPAPSETQGMEMRIGTR